MDARTRSPTPGANPAAVRLFGRYQAHERIGGEPPIVVYRARTEGLAGFDRTFALRVLEGADGGPPSAEAAARFIQAGKRLLGLRDPRLVTAFEVGREHGLPFLASEFVFGAPLAALADPTTRHKAAAATSSRWTELLAHIGAEVGEALASAHALRPPLIHGALDAHAVIISTRGTVRVIEAGLRVAVAAEPRGRRTLSAPHAPPEMALGAGPSAAGDVYALGALLFHLVSGRQPNPGQSAADVTAALAAHGDRLARVVARLLTPDAGARPSAKEAALLLRGAAGKTADAERRAQLAALARKASAPARREPLDAGDAEAVDAASIAAGPGAAGDAHEARLPGDSAEATSLDVVPLAAEELEPWEPEPLPPRIVTPPAVPIAATANSRRPGPDLSDLSNEELDRMFAVGMPGDVTSREATRRDERSDTLETAGMMAALMNGAPARPHTEHGFDEDSATGFFVRRSQGRARPQREAASDSTGGLVVESWIPSEVGAAESTEHPADAQETALEADALLSPLASDLVVEQRAADTLETPVLVAGAEDSGAAPAAAAAPVGTEAPWEPLFPEAVPQRRRSRAWVVALIGAAVAAGGVAAVMRLREQPQPVGAIVARHPVRPARTPTPAAPATAEEKPSPALAAEPPPATVPGTDQAPATAPPATVAGTESAPPAVGGTEAAGPGAADGRSIAFVTTPPGATVWINGAERGATPLTLQLKPRISRIAVVRAGYVSIREPLDPASIAGEWSRALTPAPIPKWGRAGLAVSCTTAGKYPIIIDGNETGLLCPADHLALPAGPHEIAIFLPWRNRTFPVNVTLRADATKIVSYPK